ncbi:MAG: hypothetical protein LBS74_06960 [Oscillospiraceae bacterium]|jgi:hypothetical protein|nr:hypothetical protein [Oscillospiraceae bacterium]
MKTNAKRFDLKLFSHRLLKWIALCLGLIIVFYALMVLAYCIPESLITEHRTAAEAQLLGESKGIDFNYPPPSAVGKTGVTLDSYTDRLIMKYSGNPLHQNPFVAAVEDSYARYWHGYVILTRPALALVVLVS